LKLLKNPKKALDISTRELLTEGNVEAWDTTMLFQMLMGVEAAPWATGTATVAPHAQATAMRSAIDELRVTRNSVCHVRNSRVVTIDKLRMCMARCDAFINAAFPDPDKRQRWISRRRALSENHGAFDKGLLASYAEKLRQINAKEHLLNQRERIADNLKRQQGVQLAYSFSDNAARHRQLRAEGTREWCVFCSCFPPFPPFLSRSLYSTLKPSDSHTLLACVALFRLQGTGQLPLVGVEPDHRW
jgi:hypothetical protein